MKFERTEEQTQKLFEQALFDEKNVIQDADVTIEYDYNGGNKLKAFCEQTNTYLQFPRALREDCGQQFKADVIEVKRDDGVRKYYRALKGTIRNEQGEVVG